MQVCWVIKEHMALLYGIRYKNQVFIARCLFSLMAVPNNRDGFIFFQSYCPTGPFFQYFTFFQRVSEREPEILYTPHLK